VEINRRFDDIVEFSEISRFLDTPVKRYSSGMYVRLAFAVAAHLEPEILVIDEVLAVGDAAFQRRCLGRMENVADSGRTVLFVSHNMQAVRSLCTRVVELSAGRVVNVGPASEVVDNYLKLQWGADGQIEWSGDERPGDDDVRIAAVRVLGQDGRPTPVVVRSQPFLIQMDLDVARVPHGLTVGFDLTLADGSVAFRTYHTDGVPAAQPRLSVGRNSLICQVGADLLNTGRYTVNPRISIDRVRWIMHFAALSFEVHVDPNESETVAAHRPGAVAPLLAWSRNGDGT
jgi:lipopolysaccharide transport system ATP-binding protein